MRTPRSYISEINSLLNFSADQEPLDKASMDRRGKDIKRLYRSLNILCRNHLLACFFMVVLWLAFYNIVFFTIAAFDLIYILLSTNKWPRDTDLENLRVIDAEQAERLSAMVSAHPESLEANYVLRIAKVRGLDEIVYGEYEIAMQIKKESDRKRRIRSAETAMQEAAINAPAV